MTQQITLDLPDAVYDEIAAAARLSGRDMGELLAEALGEQ